MSSVIESSATGDSAPVTRLIKSVWLRALILVVLAAIVYAPTFGNQLLTADNPFARDSAALRSSSGLGRIWLRAGASTDYAPLTHSILWCEYRLLGSGARSFHAVNFALHVITALLVWRLLARVGLPGAWWAALLCAVHPAVVENVAWTGGRSTVLATLFSVASLLCYWRSEAPSSGALTGTIEAQRSSWLDATVAAILYAAAVLSSPVAAGLPVAMLVIEWWQRGRIDARDVVPLTPLFATGLILVTLSILMRRPATPPASFLSTIASGVVLAGQAFWLLPLRMLSPYPLAMWAPAWDIDPSAWWQYIFPLAAIALVAVLWFLRGAIGRGPVAWALLLFCALLPAVGMVGSRPLGYPWFAEQIQYPTAIILAALLVAGAERLGRNLPVARTVAPWAAGALVLLSTGMAHLKAMAFADDVALAEDIVTHDPNCWLAHQQLGERYRQGQDFERASEHWRRAAEIRDRDLQAHPESLDFAMQLAATHAQLGEVLVAANRRDEGLQSHRQSLNLREQFASRATPTLTLRADLAASYLAVGLLERDLGRSAEADAALTRAVDLGDALIAEDPTVDGYRATLTSSYAALGVLQQTQGRLKPAEYSLRRATTLGEELVKGSSNEENLSTLAAAYMDLGQLLNSLGRAPQAEGAFDRAVGIRKDLVRLQPANKSYQTDLGWSYSHQALARLRSGRPSEAATSTRKAIELREPLARENPENDRLQNDLAASYVDLGILLREMGRPAEALPWFEKSIGIREKLAERAAAGSGYPAWLAWSYANRGTALLANHQEQPAVEDFTKAVALREQLRGDDGTNLDNLAALAWSYAGLGLAQLTAGRLEEAEAAYRRALEIRQALHEKNSTGSELRRELALSYRDLGNTELALGKITESIDDYKAAIVLREQLAVEDTSNPAWKANLALDLALCADALAVDGHWNDSAELYLRALSAVNSPWQILWRLALVQLGDDDQNAYRATCMKLVDRTGEKITPEMRFPISLTLVAGNDALGDRKEVLAIVQRCAEAEPENPLLAVLLGAAEYRAGLRAQSRATLAKAIPQLDTFEADTPEKKDQQLVVRMIGEALLARAYRERTGRALGQRQIAILRDLIATPQAPPPQSQARFPAWGTRLGVKLAEREVADLGIDEDEAEN